MINLSRNKYFCCGLKKVVAKSRARVCLEQQILAVLLFFSSNSQLVLDPHQASQPISALHFFNPQQFFLLRDKLITRGEKRETSTPNLQRKNVSRKVEGFCISYFAALMRGAFSNASYINIYGLLTKCEVKMAGYWPSSFFTCLRTETEKHAIKERGSISFLVILNKHYLFCIDILYCKSLTFYLVK